MDKTLTELREEYPQSFLLEYIEKCRSSEIIVGQELLLEFKILLKNFNDPKIKIDFTDAHKRIKFIEKECKHSQAPFAGKPFILMLFQKAFIEAFYSFKVFDYEIGKEVRLFQELMLLCGRKNGKTPFISAINLAEFFCGDEGTEIICASNDYKQANIMFQAINNMRFKSPTLEKVTHANINGIYFGNPRKPKFKGKFSYQNTGKINKLSAKSGAKEGYNIRVGAVDEEHEMADDSLVTPIQQALSTQDNPIFEEISTEGFVNDGYLDKRLKEARQVLNGELDRPRWLIFLYTQDSESEIWSDEKSWYKSNPGLGVIKKWSYLRRVVEESKTNMQKRVYVLAKDFNRKQNNAKAWLTESVYKNEATFDIEEFRGRYAIGAADLAETTDLISVRMMLMRAGDNRKYMIQKYFIPEAKLDCHDDDKDYREWHKQGLIEVCPGNDNDFSYVTKWFVDLYKKYKIRPFKIGYDTALAKYWVKEMEELFDEDTMVKVPQKREVMSNPMNLLEADLRSKIINYNNNPIDRWNLSNVAIDMDKRGLIMPVKVNGRRDKRIDGAVTMIICESIFQQYKSDYLKYVG